MQTLRNVTLLLVALAMLAGCASGNSSGAAGKPASAAAAPGQAAATSGASSSLPALPADNPTQLPVDAKPAPSPGGPYATREAAERFVRTQGEPGSTLTPISPQSTWRPAATLHVIHATFEGSASWAGDWYFFFVHGNLVGKRYFTRTIVATAVDDTTFSIAYDVFRQGDPHCCPSGGQATVRFQWNGNQLTRLDPLPGPVMG
jgi:hypothetical protein